MRRLRVPGRGEGEKTFRLLPRDGGGRLLLLSHRCCPFRTEFGGHQSISVSMSHRRRERLVKKTTTTRCWHGTDPDPSTH